MGKFGRLMADGIEIDVSEFFNGDILTRRIHKTNKGKNPLSKINDVNPNGSWWEATESPYYGNAVLDIIWARLGLELMALAGGPPRLEGYKSGTLKEEIGGFIDKIQALGLRLVSKNGDEKSSIQTLVNPRSCASVEFKSDSSVEVALETNDPDLHNKFKELLQSSISTKQNAGRVHVMVSTSYGPDFESMGIGGHTIERGNYTDEVLLAYDQIIKDLKSSDPMGRLSIFNGPAGTGKSYLIRAILQEADNSVCVVVPSHLLVELSSPSIIPSLIELRKSKGKDVPIVFLVEDADECLVHREDGNMSAISAVLNLCDGIIGSMLDIRIIATTNANKMELDKALIRPGRLSANVEVHPLVREKAESVLKRLNPNITLPEGNKFTLAELYSLSRGGEMTATGISNVPKGKMGF